MSLQATTTGQSIVFDGTGPAVTFEQGDYTGAVLFKRSAYNGAVVLWNTYEPSGFAQRQVGMSGGNLFYNGASDVAASSLASGKWYWIVVTRGATASPARYHWAELTASGALSWTHVDGVGNNGAASISAIDRVIVGDPFGNGFQGDIAALALFGPQMTDAEVEATFGRAASLIDAADPLFFATFPAASAASPLPDLAGGAGETSRTAGWTVTADPTGFDPTLGPPPNVPPTVNGGADRSILTGATTTLAATATDSDGTVASVTWSQVSGPAATLGGSGASRTFTPSTPGVYVFSVVAVDDDGASSATDTVTVTVTDPPNAPPTVNAGPDRSIFLGQSTTLTATGADSDGTVASYAWSQVSGPTATLTGTGASRTFTPTDVGTYVFQAVATDDDGATSLADTVTIGVFLPPPPPAGSGVRAFDNLEQGIMALITGAGLVLRDGTEIDVPDAQVGGDFGFDQETMPWYIRIDRVPGGSGDRHQADFIIDLEVFGADYLLTESVAFALEALLLGYPHVVEVGGRKMVLDDVTQNVGVADLPWEDDSTYRLGATYVITRRR